MHVIVNCKPLTGKENILNVVKEQQKQKWISYKGSSLPLQVLTKNISVLQKENPVQGKCQ